MLGCLGKQANRHHRGGSIIPKAVRVESGDQDGELKSADFSDEPDEPEACLGSEIVDEY